MRAALADHVTIDYSNVVPAWGEKHYAADDFVELWLSPEHLGLRPLATQHLLGLPLFKSVEDARVVVEWQIIASHGRRAPGEDATNPMARIEEESNHRGFLEHSFVRIDKGWKIQKIKPSVTFQPGDFMHVRRPE